MEAIPLKITPAAARRFLDALAESPAQPAGPHPTEADAIAYVLDTCTSAEADRIDAHLAGCDECLAWLERLFEYASAGRAYARSALPECPPDAPELRAVLIPLGQLRHKRPHIRQTGAEALGEIRSELAVPALLAALGDTDDDVRKFAADALGKIGSTAAAPALTRILQQDDGDIWVRMAAAEALGRIGTPEARPVLKAVAAATDHKDLRDIATLAARIAPAPSHAVPVVTLICERLRDWVREWAETHAPGYAPAGAFQGADAKYQEGVLEYFQGETRKDLHYSLARESGGLRISFSTQHLDMGRRLTLRAGDLAFPLELQPIGQVALIGDILLSCDQAVALALESAWIVEWQGLDERSEHCADGVDDEPCEDIAEPNLSNEPHGKTIELDLDNPFTEASCLNNALTGHSLENADAFTTSLNENADAFTTSLNDNQAPTASPRKRA